MTDIPTSVRRDPQRREQLLDAADRVIARLGAAVRMDDIAAEAGVTKPILYRHFGSKGGLYEAVARRSARLVEQQLEVALAAADGPRQKLAASIDAFLAAIEERPQTYRFLLNGASAERPEVSAAVGDFTHHLARRYAGVLEEQFARFGLVLHHAELLAHCLVGAVHQASDWWINAAPPPGRDDQDVARDELRSVLVRLLWSGLPSVAVDGEPGHEQAPDGVAGAQ